MRACVVGTGSLGAFLGARFVLAGLDVTLVGKGAHLEALSDRGLHLCDESGHRQVTGFRATARFEEAGEQDAVFLAVKAFDIPAAAPELPHLLGPETPVVTLQNGIPWWYFHRHGGPYEGRRFLTLDPDGVIEAHVPAERVIGCVAYPAAELLEPGVVRHVEGDHFPVGELDGLETDRVRALVKLFQDTGFRSRVLTDVRAEIWLKAWGSLSFNPISALTGATMEEICRHPATRELARAMMEEAAEVCRKLDVRVRHTVERRIAGAESVGPHKTSMLQDVEAARRLEHEALLGSVLELARLTETAAPAMEAVYALVGLLDARLQANHPYH